MSREAEDRPQAGHWVWVASPLLACGVLVFSQASEGTGRCRGAWPSIAGSCARVALVAASCLGTATPVPALHSALVLFCVGAASRAASWEWPAALHGPSGPMS